MTISLQNSATVLILLASFGVFAGELARNPSDPAAIRGTSNVRWREWNAETLKDAEKSGKPIFLFVTSNWCHRGKVMERVTFGDLEVCAHLNEEFIAIKLNRDERPDVDLRMQIAVQALTGSRGLPLTVFLTPQGRPFYGGTFYPADDDAVAEKPGLRGVINQMIRNWRVDREAVLKQGAAVEAAVQQAGGIEGARGEVSAELVDAAVEKTRASLDLGGAGESTTGRFPSPRALDLLLAHHARTGDVRSLQAVTRTLDAMLRGGIFDRLEGGFYRCTTDVSWRLPRFEKLLTVNAEMLPVLVRAWKTTKDERYKNAAVRTLAYWSGMLDPTGTYFFGSQAGGTNDVDDGDYYTWTVKEIEQVLRDDADCRLATVFYDIGETGDFPSLAPERNALYEAMPLSDAAKQVGLSLEQANARVERIHRLLLTARSERPKPTIDRNLYVDGNALMAAAFIECGRELGMDAIAAQGLKTLDGLLKQRGVHVVSNDPKNAAPATSQDDAAVFYACAVAIEKGSAKFATAADECFKRLEKCWDAKDSGYFDATESAEPLGKARLKIWQDTTDPGTNGLIAMACVRFNAVSPNKEYVERSRAIVGAFAKFIGEASPYASTLAGAAAKLQFPAKP